MTSAVGGVRGEFNHCVNNYKVMPNNTKGWTWAKSIGAGVAVGAGILIIAAIASRGNRLGLGFGLGITGGALTGFGTMWYITHNYTPLQAIGDHAESKWNRAKDKANEFVGNVFDWFQKKRA
jgi:hypothetical protein